MKAIIPAAGFGTRMLPATKSMPKEMMPVLGKPVIQYVVEEAAASGIDDVIVVTGRNKRAIEDHFDANPELEALLRAKANKAGLEELRKLAALPPLFYVRQAAPQGLGHAVLQAEPHVRGQSFAVLLGDDIITAKVPATKQLRARHEELGASVFCVQTVGVQDVSRYGIVETEKAGKGLHRVVDIVEKPSREEAPSRLAVMGRYVFTPALMPALAKTKPGVGGEIQLTDAIRALLKKEEVYCLEFDGTRYDIGTVDGWLDANVRLGMLDPRFASAVKVAAKQGAARIGKGTPPVHTPRSRSRQ